MQRLAFEGDETEVRVITTSRQGRCVYERSAPSVVSVDFTQSINAPPDGFGFLDDLIDEIEADPKLADDLADARRMVSIDLHGNTESLAALRLSQGLSQTHLAKMLGTSQPAVSQIEAGSRQPSLATLRRLAEVLCVDMNAIDRALPR